jgi:hypothetical protein
VNLWDELSAEESVIMNNALEEACLSGVIDGSAWALWR